MHSHSQSGTTLAAAVLDNLITADELLNVADTEDRLELRDLLTRINPSEFTNLLQFAAAAAILLAPAEEEPSAPESEAVATMDAPKENPAHV
jgi:hypothetical protein